MIILYFKVIIYRKMKWYPDYIPEQKYRVVLQIINDCDEEFQQSG